MFIKKISAQNFLSFNNVEHSFAQEPTVVQGINETDEGQKSNGSGKSAFLSIIEYCLLFTNSRGVRDSELISYGEAFALLKTIIHCPVRGEELNIEVTINKKGSNKIKLTLNDEENNANYSNSSDAKSFILNWLGMEKEDIYSFFLINRARFKSFFSYSNTEKISITNRFSDSSILEGIDSYEFSNANSRLTKVNSQKLAKEGVRNYIAEELSGYMSNINSSDQQGEAGELRADIDFLNGLLGELEQNTSSLNKKIGNCKIYLSKGEDNLNKKKLELKGVEKVITEKNIKISSIREYINNIDLYPDSIASKDNEVLKINAATKNYNTKLSKVDIKLGGVIGCPNCKHDFLLDAGGSIKEYKKLKTLLEKNILKNGIKVDSLQAEIDNEKLLIKKSITKKEREITEIKKELISYTKKRDSIQNEIDVLNNEIRDYEGTIKMHKRSVEQYEQKSKEHKDSIEETKVKLSELGSIDYQKKIDNSFKELSKVLEEIQKLLKLTDKIKEEIQNEEFWKEHFKHFKTFLANKSVKVIESHTNLYLKNIGSDLRVAIEGFKVLSNGKVKDSITPYIIRNGETRHPNSLSAGELSRVVYASILALQHLVNNENEYGGLKLLIIDEVLDSVDSEGLENLIKESKNLNQLVMLVSHSYTETIDVNNITIVKQNGLSKIHKDGQ